MEKLRFGPINNTNEIDLFLKKVLNYTGVQLPMSYVNNSRIIGIHLKNELVAGYMLVTKPKFRSLLFVPDKTKKTDKFFTKDQYEMMEVNGLWIGPQIKNPKHQFQIWMHLVTDIFTAKKKYLLLMSNSKNKNIRHIHKLTGSEILYEGSPELMVGDKSHESIRVGYTTRWKLLYNMPKYWLEFRSRERRFAKSVKSKPLIHTSATS